MKTFFFAIFFKLFTLIYSSFFKEWYLTINILRYDQNIIQIVFPDIYYHVNEFICPLHINENLEIAAFEHINYLEEHSNCDFSHDSCNCNMFKSCKYYDRISYYLNNKHINIVGETLLKDINHENTLEEIYLNLNRFLLSLNHKNIILDPKWDYIGIAITENMININFAKNTTILEFCQFDDFFMYYPSFQYYLIDSEKKFLFFFLYTNTKIPNNFKIILKYYNNTYLPIYNDNNRRLFIYKTLLLNKPEQNIHYTYNLVY